MGGTPIARRHHSPLVVDCEVALAALGEGLEELDQGETATIDGAQRRAAGPIP